MKKDNGIKKTFRISITEGMFAQIYGTIAGIGSIFLTKFLILLGAGPAHFGIYSAIGQISQIFQPFGVLITEKLKTKKGIVVFLSLAGRLLAFFMGFLPFIPGINRVNAFLLLLFFSSVILSIGGNIWIEWISDLIPLKIRGKFFSLRMQYLMMAGLISGYVFSFFVDSFEGKGNILSNIIFKNGVNADQLKYVFLALFSLAALMAVISAVILLRQPERRTNAANVGFGEKIKNSFNDGNFRKLLFYNIWWMLAVGIGAPFWQPFMINKLNMTLFNMQIYGTISTIASILAIRPIGVLIDRFGNKPIMRFLLILAGINPAIWLFINSSNYSIIYFEAFTSGIMWSGAAVISTNFVLSIAPDGMKQIYSAINGAVSGIAIMLTMLLSGFIRVEKMNIAGLDLEPEQVLFGLTAIARWSAEIPLSFVKEPFSRPAREVVDFLLSKIRHFNIFKKPPGI